MKYHIDFEDNRLSFDVLEDPASTAWFEVLRSDLDSASATRIYRSAFPKVLSPVGHFNRLRDHYTKVQDKFGLDCEFELNLDYNKNNYIEINKSIDILYRKVVVHNFYYSHEHQKRFRFHVKRLKRCIIELLDCLYHAEENYAQIKLTVENPHEVAIPMQMRKNQWVEKARPKLVIRAWPNFDLESLDVLERRNDSSSFNEQGLNQMHYITSDHKICYYETPLDQSQAAEYMTDRRGKILDFVDNNNLDAVPGAAHHYYFVPPVVAHCTNESDYTEQELREMFDNNDDVTITIEE